jgi:hypothetical protein
MIVTFPHNRLRRPSFYEAMIEMIRTLRTLLTMAVAIGTLCRIIILAVIADPTVARSANPGRLRSQRSNHDAVDLRSLRSGRKQLGPATT